MRKKVFGYQLDRDKNERQALFRSLVCSLIDKGEISTTLTKAKAIQPQIEKLVTKAKKGTLADKRVCHRFLTKNSYVNKLFVVIAPVFKDRIGGYTRIVKEGPRKGDNAEMVKIMFVEKITTGIIKEKPVSEKKSAKTEKVQSKEVVEKTEKPALKKKSVKKTVKKTKK